TKLYVNLSEPSVAANVAKQDVDGVGLLRAEFMVAQIGVHPKKLIEEKKEKKFINYLADGLRTFCESFNPRPVVYRATDFKTNEYKNLTGGRLFEPQEENPMMGYRGAYRYLADSRVFELELEAIKIVRRDLGLTNLFLMIPFVRTVQELILVKKILAKENLLADKKFKLWMMVEIPSNVILIEEFIKAGLDGVSIGSNDLTMLTLGVDRDNSELQTSFDERDAAVLWSMERVIKAASRAGVSSSICGQAPSLYPDLVEKLVAWGISSISVTPDAISQTRTYIANAEEELLKKR
ncbi:phosphoenolpyruvate synthase, partial [Candidatus Microgenomates bacterium]|nr:phosphoenolpyruvate synthase [Candidatus Microgenomates bacterium]